MAEFRPSRPSDIPALRQLWKAAFGDPDSYLDIFFGRAYGPERSRVICLDGEIAGAAYWLDCDLNGQRLAYLYAVAISPERQNQGLGSALMKDIHRQLRAEGYAGAILVPGDEGLRQYYRRFHYETVSFQRECSAAPEEMARIDVHRFARLRRQYLPKNGILQEGENLALLEALAQFYEGSGCVAAFSRIDGKCLELLPRPSAREKPFAMALALTGSPLPNDLYFGFGFD